MNCNNLPPTKFSRYFLRIAFAIGIFYLVSCNQSSNPKPTDAGIKVDAEQSYTDTSSSFVKVYDDKGKLCIQQSNTYYQLADVYDGSTKIPLLLKINKVELCLADSVNKQKFFKISAKSILDNRDLHWTSDFVATDIRFNDNTLIAVREGTDGEEDYISRFSLLNGKKIFACSYADLKVSIPNVRSKRFVGFTSRAAASQPIQESKEENLIAVIDYSSSEKQIDKLKLKLKRSALAAKIPSYSPEMIFVSTHSNTSVIEDGKTVILMKADEHYQPSDIKDFSVQYTFYFGDDNEATKIIIPVANDHLDIAHASYDKDIFELVQD